MTKQEGRAIREYILEDIFKSRDNLEKLSEGPHDISLYLDSLMFRLGEIAEQNLPDGWIDFYSSMDATQQNEIGECPPNEDKDNDGEECKDE